MENYTEERPWGRWTEYHNDDGYRLKEMVVKPGQRMSYQYHEHRSEHWFVVRGTATIVYEGETIEIPTGGSFDCLVGKKHRIGNAHEEDLIVIEVQYGAKLVEEDIIRLEDDYNRAAVDEGEVTEAIEVTKVTEVS